MFTSQMFDWPYSPNEFFPQAQSTFLSLRRRRVSIEISFYMRSDPVADAGTQLFLFGVAFDYNLSPPDYMLLLFDDVAGQRKWHLKTNSGAVIGVDAITPVPASFSLWETGEWYRLKLSWAANGSDNPRLTLINETRNAVVENNVDLGPWLANPVAVTEIFFGSGAEHYGLSADPVACPLVIREWRL